MQILFEVSWTSKTLIPAKDSFQEQGRRLELQILDSSRLAYDKLLLNIEWSVWWYIIQPPSQAAQSMFTFLKTVHLNPGPRNVGQVVGESEWSRRSRRSRL